MEDKTFEQKMLRLEEIVAKLEKGDVPLSDSLALFEEGTGLAASCRTQLDRAEQQVVRLMRARTARPLKRNLPGRNERMNYEERYAAYLQAIEEYLSGLFTADKPYARLYESMRYSVLSGRQAHPARC